MSSRNNSTLKTRDSTNITTFSDDSGNIRPVTSTTNTTVKKHRKKKKESFPPWKSIVQWPDKKEKFRLEHSFILDGNAIDNLQVSYGGIHPKLGSAIPPYNAHYDEQVKNYFKNKGVKANLRKTGQIKEKSESIEGKYVDNFHQNGWKNDYLTRRNIHGAGHARELVEGHSRFMKGIKYIAGYNGENGYRTNVPSLRNKPTPFGYTDLTYAF